MACHASASQTYLDSMQPLAVVFFTSTAWYSGPQVPQRVFWGKWEGRANPFIPFVTPGEGSGQLIEIPTENMIQVSGAQVGYWKCGFGTRL